jgi:hypothetical protein
MKPLIELSSSMAQNIEGLFFDLDDTFLSETRLSEAAYASLFRLNAAGLRLIALTGRPASWADIIARMWPVEAAIAENGALGYERYGDQIVGFDFCNSSQRVIHQRALQRLVARVREDIPELVPADDAVGRISDFTFDIGEHQMASEAAIEAAQGMARRAGARTTRSSVHLHLTFDRSDKATGALGYLRRKGEDVTRARSRFCFIGDSQNDAPCFAAFSHSFAVANLRGRFSILPQFLTEQTAEKGFCEFADRLLEFRSGGRSAATPTKSAPSALKSQKIER